MTCWNVGTTLSEPGKESPVQTTRSHWASETAGPGTSRSNNPTTELWEYLNQVLKKKSLKATR